MTRSTRHITPRPQLAALVFAAMRLGLENRQETPKQSFISEQMSMEMLDTRKSTGAMSATNRHHPLTSMFLGGNDVR